MATKKYAQSTIDRARKAIVGMRQIAINEMLDHEGYISDTIDQELRKQGAVCGGHKACAMGSLWLGYGVRPKRSTWGGWELPGLTDEYKREDFLKNRPGLRLAVYLMDDQAEEYINTHNINERQLAITFPNAIECLFEGEFWQTMQDRDAVWRVKEQRQVFIALADNALAKLDTLPVKS